MVVHKIEHKSLIHSKHDNDCSVFLASLKAGGVGLNLTEADHVFFVDPWWNPAVEDQAADPSASESDKPNPSLYTDWSAKIPLKNESFLLQERKRQLAETALGGASQGTSITKEDLLELLK